MAEFLSQAYIMILTIALAAFLSIIFTIMLRIPIRRKENRINPESGVYLFGEMKEFAK